MIREQNEDICQSTGHLLEHGPSNAATGLAIIEDPVMNCCHKVSTLFNGLVGEHRRGSRLITQHSLNYQVWLKGTDMFGTIQPRATVSQEKGKDGRDPLTP
jgi:hypothetical protein